MSVKLNETGEKGVYCDEYRDMDEFRQKIEQDISDYLANIVSDVRILHIKEMVRKYSYYFVYMCHWARTIIFKHSLYWYSVDAGSLLCTLFKLLEDHIVMKCYQLSSIKIQIMMEFPTLADKIQQKTLFLYSLRP